LPAEISVECVINIHPYVRSPAALGHRATQL